MGAFMMDELTERERQAAYFARLGMSNKKVASQMKIAESTVEQYLHRVYGKLGVSGRGGLSVSGESPK